MTVQLLRYRELLKSIFGGEERVWPIPVGEEFLGVHGAKNVVFEPGTELRCEVGEVRARLQVGWVVSKCGLSRAGRVGRRDGAVGEGQIDAAVGD